MNNPFNRRRFLRHNTMGIGSLALGWLLNRDKLLATPPTDPRVQRSFDLAPKQPHHTPKAQAMISLFMHGGPSHMDLTDPKPELTRLDGKEYTEDIHYSFANEASRKLFGSPWKFRRHGQCGMDFSELLPHTAAIADDLCLIRSMHTGHNGHEVSIRYMNAGVPGVTGRPSLGAWLTYGLGSESDDLPSYIVMLDPDGTLVGGPPCWGAGYFPPIYQGTLFRPEAPPILNLRPSGGRTIARQQRNLDLIRRLNRINRRPDDPVLETRAATYELAFRMQKHAPEAVDISRETAETQRLYGVDRAETSEFGRRCLLSRRLVERGVRFVQLYSGGGPGNMTWDGHGDIEENHLRMAGQVDQPIAGLLKDLKRRGLLESTLVIWAGEFGRTPMSQGKTGRDHSPFGFSIWMAGAGLKGGRMVGATDEIGLRAVENPYHVRDLHATILDRVGLDQDALTFLHNGRDERLTDIGGRVISELV